MERELNFEGVMDGIRLSPEGMRISIWGGQHEVWLTPELEWVSEVEETPEGSGRVLRRLARLRNELSLVPAWEERWPQLEPWQEVLNEARRMNHDYSGADLRLLRWLMKVEPEKRQEQWGTMLMQLRAYDMKKASLEANRDLGLVYENMDEEGWGNGYEGEEGGVIGVMRTKGTMSWEVVDLHLQLDGGKVGAREAYVPVYVLAWDEQRGELRLFRLDQLPANFAWRDLNSPGINALELLREVGREVDDSQVLEQMRQVVYGPERSRVRSRLGRVPKLVKVNEN